MPTLDEKILLLLFAINSIPILTFYVKMISKSDYVSYWYG